MKEQEFKEWLDNTLGLAKITINTYIYDIRRIARVENVNIDDEFDRDELTSLLELYKYSTDDEGNGRQNPTHMDIQADSLISALRSYRSHLNQYRKFRLSEGDDFVYNPQEDEPNESTGLIFALENDLQNVMRETITQLEPGLVIIDGDKERKVATGFIDILAQDRDEKFVVIELKSGKANAAVIGQILGYMVDIAESSGLEFNQIRGIIVAGDFNKRVRYATRAIPNLSLKSYRYAFNFKDET